MSGISVSVDSQCDLVQFSVVKSGVTAVFGSCANNVNWSALAGDYILLNMLLSSRYSKVVCLNLDRHNFMDVCEKMVGSYSKRDGTIKSKGTGVAEDVASTTPGGWKKKLCILDSSEVLSTPERFTSIILNKFKESLETLRTEKLPGQCSLVVNSFSEIILNVGIYQTKKLIAQLVAELQQYITWTNALNREALLSTGTSSGTGSGTSTSYDSPSDAAAATATAAPVSSSVTPSIVLVVHETLHSAAVLSQIQSLASVVVRVLPNSGTLSDTVAAEIQSMRRYAYVEVAPS
jgi:hypothetical protein